MVRQVLAQVAATAAHTGVDALSPRVRAALEAVPRHRFVPEAVRDLAYDDSALPIDCDQTISQPFIVALMTQLAAPDEGSRVLDVGTGSGYQAAVLSALAGRVYTIETVPELARRAAALLAELSCDNVEVRCGDGFAGWEEHAPFDAILVAAATPEPPPPLVEQLARGGRLVVPLGEPFQIQELVLIRKREDGTVATVRELPVAFVPLTRSRC